VITRQQLVADIDLVDEANIEVLHKIILALKAANTPKSNNDWPEHRNPLKNSVTFEKDILTPIDDEWNVDR